MDGVLSGLRHRTFTYLFMVLILGLVSLLGACDTGTPFEPTEVTSASIATLTNPSGALPANAPKPAPPQNTFDGCPSTGDGGDRQLNIRKNRTDSAAWYPVSISSILALKWPFDVAAHSRTNWSASSAAQIAQYEGLPLQIEGYLAGAKQQGPETCNCHSVNDVDYHLWIVDSPNKDRTQSVVAEITPRVRATHPGWAFQRIRPLVDGRTKVRISGWLLMDQEHPDQVGKTRGTIWEIHPIIAFDVLQGSTWVSLDTGRASNTSVANSEAVPTEDPNLPPPISDPFQGTTMPTPTPQPGSAIAGGHAVSNGPVVISDIFYDGKKSSSEPDEYVEIANTGSQPVSMDGWVLHDIYGGQEFAWHGFTIQGGQKIRVYTNEVHKDTGGFSFGSKSAIWANKGDAAELLDASGQVVSTFSYGGKQ